MPRKPKDELKSNKNTDTSMDNHVSKASTVKKSKKTSNSKAIDKSTSKKETKKETASKSKTSKKSINKKPSKKAVKKDLNSTVEYYDLPYRYNETAVRILAQTPTNLFIYWDISDDDKASYIQKYGSDFFNKTKPILIVKNNTLNYKFEIEINDFANSWYVHVNDANCDYSV